MPTTTTSAARAVTIPAQHAQLSGDLTVPSDPIGLVVFAHGSGRGSPRNRYVASMLNERGLATLLFDLLTPDEASVDDITRHLRFDIAFLAERLVAVTDWLAEHPTLAKLPLAYFGASTGAAAALVAAALRPHLVRAVVSRGGRPDLAASVLDQIHAPTLLIVGGDDHDVIRLNEQAFAHLTSPKELVLVNGATHLFEEPGTIEEVAYLASAWFERHLRAARRSGEVVDEIC